jgi:hypothetical protein
MEAGYQSDLENKFLDFQHGNNFFTSRLYYWATILIEFQQAEMPYEFQTHDKYTREVLLNNGRSHHGIKSH